MKFEKRYLAGFMILLVAEIFIALYIKDEFIRPFFGDFLAVIAVYFLVMSFVNVNRLFAIIFSLIFAYFIELLQYIDFLSLVNWKSNKFLRILLGRTFHSGDIVAYTMGALLVFVVENKRKKL